MKALICILSLAWVAYLLLEARRAKAHRRAFRHVIHVNGTRGKSTVSRLIDAGLRAGGWRVFTKTTGTDPETIGVSGEAQPLRRRGTANIKEQLGILRRGAEEGAEVLVVECMALQPELQRVSQRDILQADVGVITNVRLDHTDVMGRTLPEIAQALSNTVPVRGALFTAEEGQAPLLRQKADALGSSFAQIRPDGTEPDFDFPENIALALAVCRHLGVGRETALAGMRDFQRDPYALSLHQYRQSLFINGLSINDIQSTCAVYSDLCQRLHLEERPLTLLINSRADRGARTQDMLAVCQALRPARILLLGASKGYLRRRLSRLLPGTPAAFLPTAQALDDAMPPEGGVVFAVGNIAGEGRALIAKIRKEGTPLVQ